MLNYKNGKIYKIVSDQTDKIYVGSTICALSQWLAQYKQDVNKIKNNKKINVTSKLILQYYDAKIILIEIYFCNSKEELSREQYWQDHFKFIIVNKQNAKVVDKKKEKQLRKKYRQKDPEKYKAISKKLYN
jgi:hypothetical protein